MTAKAAAQCFIIGLRRCNYSNHALKSRESASTAGLRGGRRSAVPESTRVGFCVFLSDRIRSQKFVKNRTRIKSHFSISAVAETAWPFLK